MGLSNRAKHPFLGAGNSRTEWKICLGSEVKNAYEIYERLDEFDPYSVDDC